ncbi:MAG: hypothetical protein IJN70_03135 [Clostridia bacterium]|nr:hypothetical protein [Clostridia bacterium]
MKRVLGFLLVLALLSASLVAVTAYSLTNESDNVTFTVFDEWGDKSYLQGVTAEMDFTLSESSWSVSFTPLGETKTEYDYNTFYDRYGKADPYYGISTPGISLLQRKNLNPELNKVFEELKAEAKNPGDIRRTRIYYRDYFRYYPVDMEIFLPEMSVTWREGFGFNNKGEYEFSGITPARGEELIKALNDFFRISVLPDDFSDITVHAGDGNSFSYGTSGKLSFSFDFMHGMTDDCFYLTFSNEQYNYHEEERTLADTSLIPGGYGIYALPFTETEIKYNELRTVYPVSSDASAEYLSADKERNELYLVLQENGKYILHVIDIATMKDTSAVELFPVSGDEYIRVYKYDDFFVILKNEVEFNVVKRTENEKYESALTGSMPSGNIADRDYFPYNSEFAFDGERLVVWVMDLHNDNEAGFLSRQPDVMVFTEDGLQYYCKWLCSLITNGYSWREVTVKDRKVIIE